MDTAFSQSLGLSVRICQKPETTPDLPGDSDKGQEMCLVHSDKTAGMGGVVSQQPKKLALSGGQLRTWGGGGRAQAEHAAEDLGTPSGWDRNQLV